VSNLVVPLYVVPVAVVAMTTVDVVTEGLWQLRLLGPGVARFMLDSSYLIRKQCFHHQQSRADSRLREEMASSPRQVVREGTEDVLAGTGTAVLAVCMGSAGHWGQSILEGVCFGSRWRKVVAGKPPVPGRCRVPYWRDAWPWGRAKSRVTTEAA
jgi:hypothetical protein